MKIAIHRQQIKSSMLPVAIIVGALFYKWIGYLSFLSPYLIFAMLFVTYCKLEPKEFKPHRSQVLELVIQLGLAAAIYKTPHVSYARFRLMSCNTPRYQ